MRQAKPLVGYSADAQRFRWGRARSRENCAGANTRYGFGVYYRFLSVGPIVTQQGCRLGGREGKVDHGGETIVRGPHNIANGADACAWWRQHCLRRTA
jgi:hypothetical protein